MRFFMFPIIVTLIISGCDKQQHEEVKAPATLPPASISTPPPPLPEVPVVVPPPQAAVVPHEVPPPSPPVVMPSVPPPPIVKAPKTPPAEPTLPSAKPDALALAKQSGCLACHNIDKKIVGPAWKDVSERYKNDTEAKAKLIAKVKAGGKGNWTEVTGGMAMPPYSPRVSDDNIEILVDFVLSLAR